MNRKKLDMTTGNPVPALLAFILPMIISQLFQQLYNMVDSIVVGRFLGEDAFAAVGASTSMIQVFICVALGSGIGCSVIIAKLYGAKDYTRLRTAISTATITIGLGGVVLACIGILFRSTFMTWLGTPANIFDLAVEYEFLYFLGLPFLFLYNIISSEFNALGDSRTPLYLLLFSSVLNIFLDLFTVLKLGMSVDGVAIATVISQFVSVALALPLLIRKIRRLPNEGAFQIYDVQLLKSMLTVAIPSIIQQSIFSVGMMLMQSTVNMFGSAALAGYAAGIKIDSLATMPMSAVSNAMSTYAAQNLGAKKPERIGLGLRCASLLCVAIAAIILVLIQLFAGDFLSIFLTSDTSSMAVDTGVGYLKFLSFFYVVIGLKFSSDGTLRAVGELKGFLLGNALNFAIRILLARMLAPVIGVCAVWYVVPVCMGINYLVSLGFYFRGKWRVREGLVPAASKN